MSGPDRHHAPWYRVRFTVVLLLAFGARAETLGYNTIGTTETASTRVLGSKWTEGSSGVHYTDAFVYIGTDASLGQDLEVAIYSDEGGVPGSLVAQSDTLATLTQESWNNLTIDFTSAANATYWILFQVDGNSTVFAFDAGDAGSGFSDPDTSGGIYVGENAWPDPYPIDDDEIVDRWMSAYLEGEPVSSGSAVSRIIQQLQ